MTQELSVAGIREACFLVYMRKLPLREASEILKRHHDLAKREFGSMSEIGIRGRSLAGDYYDED